MVSWQPGKTLDDIEKEVILAALRFYHGNKSQTAASLGVSVKTLYNKLSTYGVDYGYGLQGKSEKDEGSLPTGLQAEARI